MNRISNYYKEWDNVRNEYCKWVANCNLRKYFAKKMLIYNFSIWWVTKIVSKDNINDKEWYINLYNLINKKKNYIPANNDLILFFEVLLKSIKNLFINIIVTASYKILFYTRYNKEIKKNYFHSFSQNFYLDKKGEMHDKIYHSIYKKNEDFNAYLISIVNFNKIFFFLKFKKKNHIILNEYYDFREIFYVYYKCLINFFKLFFFLNKNKKLFSIKKIDCAIVLKPLLLRSFSGEIQNFILRAKSIKNFLKDNNNSQNFINYGEWTPGYRAVYFFIKQNKFHPKITTIQHSYSNKNKLFNLNLKNEFSLNGKAKKEGLFYSPTPDIFLTHGEQFNKILRKYFSKTKIIGVSKFDKYIFLKKKIHNKINKLKKNILICPSVGDEKILFNYLKNIIETNNNFYFCPHPSDSSTINLFNNEFKNYNNYFFYKNTKTHDYFKFSNLVICGFSSIALESAIIGLPSIRVVDLNSPYYFDREDGIRICSNLNELNKILIKKDLSFLIPKKINQIKSFFYYKIDMKTYTRFWKAIH